MSANESFTSLFRLILRPERRFYQLMLVYGIATSALSLSLPLSVQVLISTVANTAQIQPVIVLALMLFALLCLSGFFVATQIYLMELYERRFFSRIVSEVTLRLIYAEPAYMRCINRDELVNRYFDIMTVQKSLPPLLIGALATVLQTAVGVTVTSFYHPVFLLFNVAVLGCGYVVFRLFHGGATRSSITLSSRKYDTAKWLETLARSNDLFKSRRTVEFALEQSKLARENYLKEHRRHFHYSFGQIVGFLGLYAATSAVLLGVAGWLVIQGELTVGQLVAAELILTAIFYGLSRTGYYLELYYDLHAAMVKLSQFYRIPHEDIGAEDYEGTWQPSLEFLDIRDSVGGREMAFDFVLEAGGSTLVVTRSNVQSNAFTELLLNYRRADSGRIRLGGHDIDDFHPHRLRDEVHVVDGTDFPECSILEFLQIAAPDLKRAEMRQLLTDVRLETETRGQRLDLDVAITPYGFPLTVSGVIKLKIAYAIASDPKILVLSPLFDLLSRESRESVMKRIQKSLPATTVLCFSNRRDQPHFDRYMFWEYTGQFACGDLQEVVRLSEAASAEKDAETIVVEREP